MENSLKFSKILDDLKVAQGKLQKTRDDIKFNLEKLPVYIETLKLDLNNPQYQLSTEELKESIQKINEATRSLQELPRVNSLIQETIDRNNRLIKEFDGIIKGIEQKDFSNKNQTKQTELDKSLGFKGDTKINLDIGENGFAQLTHKKFESLVKSKNISVSERRGLKIKGNINGVDFVGLIGETDVKLFPPGQKLGKDLLKQNGIGFQRDESIFKFRMN